jgi:hypothetical protein
VTDDLQDRLKGVCVAAAAHTDPAQLLVLMEGVHELAVAMEELLFSESIDSDSLAMRVAAVLDQAYIVRDAYRGAADEEREGSFGDRCLDRLR